MKEKCLHDKNDPRCKDKVCIGCYDIDCPCGKCKIEEMCICNHNWLTYNETIEHNGPKSLVYITAFICSKCKEIWEPNNAE